MMNRYKIVPAALLIATAVTIGSGFGYTAFAQTVSPSPSNYLMSSPNASPTGTIWNNTTANPSASMSPSSGGAVNGSGSTGSTGSTGANGTGNVNGTTPGVPNTGTGGDLALNLSLLGVAVALAVGGAAYATRNAYGD